MNRVCILGVVVSGSNTLADRNIGERPLRDVHSDGVAAIVRPLRRRQLALPGVRSLQCVERERKVEVARVVYNTRLLLIHHVPGGHQ